MTQQAPLSGIEVRLVRHPEGLPVREDFAVVDSLVGPCGDGQVLVRNEWISVDPSMRIRMQGGPSDYMPPIELGAVPTGFTVGRVIESHSNRFGTGDVVLHSGGWREYSVLDGALTGWRGVSKVGPSPAVPPRWYLGPLGSAGLTAVCGLVKVARLQPDDIVFVSGAAGGVGHLVVQVAKARGHRVVASAGTPEKVRFLRDALHADQVFAYRDGPVLEQLSAAAPDGIDVYFDNVGGEHLEAALEVLRPGGRVALCGQISSYNSTGPVPGPANLFNATAKGLTLTGFLARMFADDVDQVRAELRQHILSGRLNPVETIVPGIENLPEGFIAMLSGKTLGKTCVAVDSVQDFGPIGELTQVFQPAGAVAP